MRTKRLAYLPLPKPPRRSRRTTSLSSTDARARSWRQAWERDPWATPGGWIPVLAEALHTVGVYLQAIEVALRRFVRQLRG